MNSGAGSSICLPGWKHNGDFSREIGSGSATDGDEDAIVGMIFALRAVESKGGTLPNWYNEVRNWADASCTSFLKYNTIVGGNNDRLLKLGSCWGGWDGNGQNSSYHSPGSFKIMRDFHVNFGERSYSLPNFGSGSLVTHWNNLIDTTYDVLKATQCNSQGMVPNWATVKYNGNTIEHARINFSGSGTPQWEFGAEAGRTIWRLALDAAVYPNDDAQLLLSRILNRLELTFDPSAGPKYWPEETFSTCIAPNFAGTIFTFSGDWRWNNFVYGPIVSSLVTSSNTISIDYQQTMIDKAGQSLSSNFPESYYGRCWTIIAILTINGSIETAGKLLFNSNPPPPPPPPPPSTGITDCGCGNQCRDSGILDQVVIDDAGSFSCRERMNWVMENFGATEEEACAFVGDEFQSVCGQGCHPDTCGGGGGGGGGGRCGCTTCTSTVWNLPATDSAGTFSCGERIEWVKANLDQDEVEACTFVSEEFPSICGQGCNPNTCGGGGGGGELCDCSSCTSAVLDRFAGSFTCRDRINWVIPNLGMSEREACGLVSQEFPSICGQGCNPDNCF